MLKACVGAGLVDITAACALSAVTLWKCDAFCGFSHRASVQSREKETIMFPKRLFFSPEHSNLQVCIKQTAAVFLWVNTLHAVSGWTWSAGLSLFDLKHSNRCSSDTSSEAFINSVKKKWIYIFYLFFSPPSNQLLPCLKFNPLKRQCGDWFHVMFLLLFFFFGLATNNLIKFSVLSVWSWKKKFLQRHFLATMQDMTWLTLSLYFWSSEQERQSVCVG